MARKKLTVRVIEHLWRHFVAGATVQKIIVTVGLSATVVFAMMGQHDHALWSSVATNLVWLWEV